MDEPLFEYSYRPDMARKYYMLRVEVSNSSTDDVLSFAFPTVSAFHKLPYTLRDAVNQMGAPRVKQYCADNNLIPDDDVCFHFIFENVAMRYYIEVSAYDIANMT